MRKNYKNAKQEIDNLKFLYGCTSCEFMPEFAAQIDLDHIDPKTKYTTITGKRLSVSDMIVARYSYELISLEVAKCQLLCKNCHLAKSNNDRTKNAK